MKRGVRFGVLGLLAAAAVGCAFSRGGLDGGFANTGGGNVTTTSTTSGTSTSATSTGTGGAPGCEPSTTQPCFDGPMGEADAGICKGGTSTCASDRTWGPCLGEVAPPQIDNCASGIGQDCMPAKCDGSVVKTFGRTLGGDKDDIATAVALDSKGNTIVVGKATGSGMKTIDFGGKTIQPNGGELDVFVAKYAPDGSLIWAQDFGVAGSNEAANGVAIAPDDSIVVVGSYDNGFPIGAKMLPGMHGVFITKLDPSGNVVWADGYTGDGSPRTANAVAVGKDGHVAVVGSTAGMAKIGPAMFTNAGGDTDGFLLYLDDMGVAMWARALRDTTGAYQELDGVAFDSKGNVLVTGQAAGDADFGDGPDTNHQNGANIAVAKYTSGGNPIWKLLLGDDYDGQVGRAITVDAQDFIYVAGAYTGTVKFDTSHSLFTTAPGALFLVKLDAGGTYQWSQDVSGAVLQHSSGLAVAADAYSVVVAGDFDSNQFLGAAPLNTAGGYDALVAKLSAIDGGSLWVQKLGGVGNDHAHGVAVDPHGAVTVVGEFDGNIDVGGGTVSTNGGVDVFLARFTP